MNHPSKLPKLPKLPALTIDLLHNSGLLIDNVFATLWKQIGMNTHPAPRWISQALRVSDWHRGFHIIAVVMAQTGFNRHVFSRQPARDGERCVV